MDDLKFKILFLIRKFSNNKKVNIIGKSRLANNLSIIFVSTQKMIIIFLILFRLKLEKVFSQKCAILIVTAADFNTQKKRYSNN